MTETAAMKAAREELEQAIKKWLRVKAADPEEGIDEEYLTSDPVLNDWIVIAGYSTITSQQNDMSLAAYDCGDQPAYASRGLALSGVDRWRFH